MESIYQSSCSALFSDVCHCKLPYGTRSRAAWHVPTVDTVFMIIIGKSLAVMSLLAKALLPCLRGPPGGALPPKAALPCCCGCVPQVNQGIRGGRQQQAVVMGVVLGLPHPMAVTPQLQKGGCRAPQSPEYATEYEHCYGMWYSASTECLMDAAAQHSAWWYRTPVSHSPLNNFQPPLCTCP